MLMTIIYSGQSFPVKSDLDQKQWAVLPVVSIVWLHFWIYIRYGIGWLWDLFIYLLSKKF